MRDFADGVAQGKVQLEILHTLQVAVARGQAAAGNVLALGSRTGHPAFTKHEDVGVLGQNAFGELRHERLV